MSPLFFGVLAQLGERNAGSVEVRGSTPLHSTISHRILFQLRESYIPLMEPKSPPAGKKNPKITYAHSGA